jgi:hypothetical protein
MVAAVLSGCASKEQIAAHSEWERQPVAAEMAEVVPHVTEAHLAECKRAIESAERPWGTKVRLTGPLKPDARSTCVLTIDNLGSLFRDSSKKKYTAYLAPMAMSGGFSALAKHTMEGCTMILEDGKVTVRPGAPVKARHGSPCHRFRP